VCDEMVVVVVGGGGCVLAECVSLFAELGLLCVRACDVGRGGGMYVSGWFHVLTFCRVARWR
jgi:hypothetical protein